MVNWKEYAPAFARYGVGIVFLIFGISQILKPVSWYGWIPSFIFSIGIGGSLFIILNGIAHLIEGGFLSLGIYARFFSAISFLHLLGIVIFAGLNFVFVRDLGLLIVLISIFLNGPDRLCLKKN